MKKLILILTAFLFFGFTNLANAQKRSYKAKTVRVKSYTTKKGKHVKSHYRSKPSKRKYSYIHSTTYYWCKEVA